MPRSRTILPFLALGCAVLACVVLSVVFTTGFDSGTKLRQLIFRLVLVTPPFLWVLRQRGNDDEPQPRRISIVPFVLLAVVMIIPISWYLRHGVYSADESAYRFQARIMRSLHAYAPAPPDTVLRQFMFKNEVRYKGRWFGKYPPGWPAVLALLSSFLLDWSVSPLLGLLLLWLLYEIAKRLYDERVAALAVGFMACSPFFLFLSLGFLSHTACAVFVAMATLSLLWAFDTGRSRYLVLTFAGLGVAFLIRPFTAVCLGLVFGVALLWGANNRRLPLYKILLIGVPITAVAVVALGYDNLLLTDHFWKSPYALVSRADTPPELQAKPANIVHNLIHFTPVSLARMELHCIPLVLALAVYGAFKGKSKRSCFLAAIILSLVIGNTLFAGVSSDSFVGERYYFEGYFAVVILAAVGWEQLRHNWHPSRQAVIAAVLAAACLTVYNYVYLARAAVQWRGGYAKVYEAAERLPGDRLLIFMQPGNFFDPSHFNANAFAWQNSRLLFALDPGDDNLGGDTASILQRPAWVVIGYDARTRSALVRTQERPNGGE